MLEVSSSKSSRRDFLTSISVVAGASLVDPRILARIQVPRSVDSFGCDIFSQVPSLNLESLIPPDRQVPNQTRLLTLASEPNLGRLVIPEKQPPEDLIPGDILFQKYNTRIHDLADQFNYIKFGFREGELKEPDSLLRRLAEREERLDIFIIDSHLLHSRFLTETQKSECPEVTAILDNQSNSIKNYQGGLVIANRNVALSRYKSYLEACERSRANETISFSQCEVERESAYYRYQKYIDPEPSLDLLLLGTYGVQTYKEDISPVNNSTTTRHHYVFVIGRNPTLRRIGDEHFRRVYDPFQGQLNTTPEYSQSHPRVEDLTIDYNQRVYPLKAGINLQVALEHEFGHVKDLNHPRPDYELIERRRRAQNLYENTGDDSGYWIYLESPSAQIFC
jgi:hypothetical protein